MELENELKLLDIASEEKPILNEYLNYRAVVDSFDYVKKISRQSILSV